MADRYGFGPWMGLEYNGHGATYTTTGGRFPWWWEADQAVQLNQFNNRHKRLVAWDSEGQAFYAPKRAVGVIMRHVRDGGWCWKIRLLCGLEIVDPARKVCDHFQPYDIDL